MEELLSVLCSNGAKISDDISVREVGDRERGIFALRSMTAGQCVLSVPRRLILTALDALSICENSKAVLRACELSNQRSEACEEFGMLHHRVGTLCLSMAILHFAAPSPPPTTESPTSSGARDALLRSFIKCMPSPENSAHLPSSWSTDMWGASLVKKCSRRCATLKKNLLDPDRLLAEMRCLLDEDAALEARQGTNLPPAALSNISEADFRWAYSMVVSRTCCLYPRGVYQQLVAGAQRECCHGGQGTEPDLSAEMALEMQALVPLFDMLNHSPNPNLQWGVAEVCVRSKSREDGWEVSNELHLQLTTTRAVAADAELHICYGPMENSELFMKYGFTMRAPWLRRIDSCTFVSVSPNCCFVSFSMQSLLEEATAARHHAAETDGNDDTYQELKRYVWTHVFHVHGISTATTTHAEGQKRTGLSISKTQDMSKRPRPTKFVIGYNEGYERLLRWARVATTLDASLLQSLLPATAVVGEAGEAGESQKTSEASSQKTSPGQEGKAERQWPSIPESRMAEVRALKVVYGTLQRAVRPYGESGFGSSPWEVVDPSPMRLRGAVSTVAGEQEQEEEEAVRNKERSATWVAAVASDEQCEAVLLRGEAAVLYHFVTLTQLGLRILDRKSAEDDSEEETNGQKRPPTIGRKEPDDTKESGPKTHSKDCMSGTQGGGRGFSDVKSQNGAIAQSEERTAVEAQLRILAISKQGRQERARFLHGQHPQVSRYCSNVFFPLLVAVPAAPS